MTAANTLSPKKSDWMNRVIDKLMLLTGTVAFAWILLFLLVAMLDK